jgi:hypothetical protein
MELERGDQQGQDNGSRSRRSELASALPAPFVVGVARSGTTLLRLMLDAHPDLAIPPETHFIPKIAQACAPPGSGQTSGREARDCVLDRFRADPHWPDFGLDYAAFARRLDELDPFTIGAALRSFYQLYAARFGKARWGDKTPRYLVQQTLIRRLLPEAHFVHLIRDGRDVWVSLRGVSFGPGTAEAAATEWQARIERARAQARGLPNYTEVRYEDLVLEPEATLRRIVTFLRLPWNPMMLTYYERAGERLGELQDVVSPTRGRLRTGVDRQRIHALTGAPPQPDRIGRWRTALDRAERNQYEAIAGPLLQELGYELDGDR